MDDNDMLDGLSSLVNMADKPEAVKKPAQKTEKPSFLAKPVAAEKPVEPTAPQVSPDLSQQILSRLDGIKAGIDALRVVDSPVVKPVESPAPVKDSPVKPAENPSKPAENPVKKPAEKPIAPKVATPPSVSPAPLKPLMDLWPYLILVSAALELVAFALGMGYGAIVAAGKYPYWYHPGASGALTDWVAAPAGILLLPIIAGLLVIGGLTLKREGREKAAKIVWGIAVVAFLAALLAPFIVA